MTTHPWRILGADAEHIPGLAECHIASWREAYRDLVSAHVLDALDVDRCAERWERNRVRYPDRTHIAIVDDTVIGFVSASPPASAHPITPAELNALYVRSAWYGSGVADDLIHAALDPALSYELWVFEQNSRAEAFYRKHGFALLESMRRIEPFTSLIEVRMARTPMVRAETKERSHTKDRPRSLPHRPDR
ncbi:GNAT family N-acetyltransferase [Nocardia sp. 004]|uniref:GNAT family N-acetyltransferase n=1 Tax=Nocardia sp. 004 TaxID=3385978 RepID=UPI0039A32DAE